MILTEDEAKTKSCVHAMYPAGYVNDPPMWPCIGSACVAWRKAPPPATGARYIGMTEREGAPKDGGWTEIAFDSMPKIVRDRFINSPFSYKFYCDAPILKTDNGYCGLAGKP